MCYDRKCPNQKLNIQSYAHNQVVEVDERALVENMEVEVNDMLLS